MKNTFPFSYIILCLVLSFTCISCKNNAENANESEADVAELQTDEQVVKAEPAFDFPTLEPIDESDKDATLQATLNELREVVKGRKVSELMPFLSDEILVSFGGGIGHNEFKDFWKLNTTEAKQSEVWQTLSNLLELGGTFTDEGTYFTIPYIFTNMPTAYDSYEYVVITGKNVRMRDRPSLKGKIVDALTYEIVKYEFEEEEFARETIDGETHEWMKITRQNEQTGYVYGKYARSPIDYRMGMTKKAGEWKIQFLVAGD